MDRASAVSLIKDTFENSFDKARFSKFVRELLNSYEEKPFGPLSGNYIKHAFKDGISSYERIGKYTDPNGDELDILIIYLSRDSSLAHARTMQRNFVAWYLNGGRGNELRDAALVAVVSPNKQDWRFSLVRMDYKIEQTPTGKIKAREEFTPARRYSFLVGAHENSHTAQQTIVPLLVNDEFPTLDEIKDSFNTEKVTKEFFEKYKELFIRVKESLDEQAAGDAKIRADFEKKGVNTADFAKKLLGQIVFLYFLQKKGWFGVARDAEWGTGPKGFIRSLFEAKVTPYTNFFNDILEPMFYEALAVDRSGDFYSRFNCKIPFLNGGLFDPINGYDWVHTDILLPNELFSNDTPTREGDTGDGILDVFDRYNFTVCEDEPLEKEVAVDPEMLGKVFENLLEVTDRKSKGAFYTPREIVHFMCQESLIHHLATEIPAVNKSDIEVLIRRGDTVIENEAKVESNGKETKTYVHKLPESVTANALALDKSLANVRVCDPAVGSGAFLVGMMNEIIRARSVLRACLNKDILPYDLKRHAIQSSLYGVDIDPGAVDIAKLRLWLSLVVDEEDIRSIKPLPNLDYKIMQGNSLLEDYDGIKLFDDSILADATESTEAQIKELESKRRPKQDEYFQLKWASNPDKIRIEQLEKEIKKISSAIDKLRNPRPANAAQMLLGQSASEARAKSNELKRLHLKYFDEAQRSRKEELRQQIASLEWDLIEVTLREQGKEDSLNDIRSLRELNVKPFFLWKLYFAEVFEEKNGFDIVIANPPYVRQEGITTIKKSLKLSYGDLFCGTADLYVYFYIRAIQSLKERGVLTFISSNKWLRAGYGEKLRCYLPEQSTIHVIADFKDLPVFENAIAYPMIMIAQKGVTCNEAVFADIPSLDPPYPNMSAVVAAYGSTMPADTFSNSQWSLANPETSGLLRKMESAGVPLGEYADDKIYRGILTGFNTSFVIDSKKRAELIAEDPKSNELIKRLIVGEDIAKWRISEKDRWLIYSPWNLQIEQYPAIHRHLLKWKTRLESRPECLSGRYNWWCMARYGSEYASELPKPKIIYQEIATYQGFAYDNSGAYLNNKVFMITCSDLYLLGLLNSSHVWQYLNHKCSKLSGGAYAMQTPYVKQVPIPQPSDSDRAAIESLVQKCLDAKGVDCKTWEKEIDERVAALYGL